MAQKNIWFTVGTVMCIMVTIVSIGWMVAREFRNHDTGTPAIEAKHGPVVIERTESNEIIVRDKASAKQMLEVINADMGNLEKAGL